MPFLIILILFGAVILAWRSIDGFFVADSQSTLNEKVFLNIDSGSVKAMAGGVGDWQNAPDRIYLYRGEALKTGLDGRATLTFFDQSIVRLNTNTEVAFSSLKKKSDSFNIQVELKKGDAWTKIERIANPDSQFSITTDLLTIDSRGAVFSVTAPGTVYVLSGSVQVGVKYDDEVIKTYTLGVGQQFTADAAQIESIKKGVETEVIFALNDSFKQTNWYHWNAKKDGMIDAFEESGAETDSLTDTSSSVSDSTDSASTSSSATEPLSNMNRVAYVTSPAAKTEVNKSTLTLEGKYDSEKVKRVLVNGSSASMSDGVWKAGSVKLLLEGENSIKLEAENMNGVKSSLDPFVIVYDKTPPTQPVITEPKITDGQPFSITSSEQIITGTVSSDTQAVIVNDYRLGKYVPGSKTFQYYAKVEYGNLKAGDNEFKIYAEDKAGNQSEPAVLILQADPSAIQTAPAAETGDSTASTTSTTSSALAPARTSGGVKITSPNNGESFTTSETEFEIAGTVPEETAKIVVNDYKLSLYTPGSTTFKYRALKSVGNLEIGKKNLYTVKAYDEDENLLGEASITIDVQSGAADDPVITMPSESATYSTTLDTLVLGGTVGKWVTRIYVNEKEVTDYIPGSEKWRTTVKLSPGKNSFTVTAERNGEPQGKDSIEINYQQ